MLTRGFSKVDSWGFGWSFTRTLLTRIIVHPINYSLEILFITTPFINNTIHTTLFAENTDITHNIHIIHTGTIHYLYIDINFFLLFEFLQMNIR